MRLVRVPCRAQSEISSSSTARASRVCGRLASPTCRLMTRLLLLALPPCMSSPDAHARIAAFYSLTPSSPTNLAPAPILSNFLSNFLAPPVSPRGAPSALSALEPVHTGALGFRVSLAPMRTMHYLCVPLSPSMYASLSL